MTTSTRQRGLTMIGFLFVAVVVVVTALVCFRVFPAYMEYFSVQKALEGALADSKDLTKADIKKLVGKRIDADYIDSVNAGDIDVSKSGNVTTAVGELADQAAHGRQRQHPAGVRRHRIEIGGSSRTGWPKRCWATPSAGRTCCARR